MSKGERRIFYRIPCTYPLLLGKTLSILWTYIGGNFGEKGKVFWRVDKSLNISEKQKLIPDLLVVSASIVVLAFGSNGQVTSCKSILLSDNSTSLLGLCYISYSGNQISSSEWLPQEKYSKSLLNDCLIPSLWLIVMMVEGAALSQMMGELKSESFSRRCSLDCCRCFFSLIVVTVNQN